MTSRLVLQHVRGAAGDDGVRAVLALSGYDGPLDVLERDGERISHDLKLALMAAAAQVLDDPDLGVHVGRSVLGAAGSSPIVALVRRLGSPERVLRHVSQISTRFATTAVFTAHEVDRGRAVLGWRLLPPYAVSRHDCGYNIGLLTQLGPLFGRPPAQVTHRACQVAGAPECVYEVQWTSRPRWWARSPAAVGTDVPGVLSGVREQLLLLQDTVADLASGTGDANAVLDGIMARARDAVHAPAHALAVRLPGDTVHLRSDGFPDGGGERAARCLLEGRPVTAEWLVVEIATSRRAYGWLAAVGAPGQRFLDDDQLLLQAYARHAALALETAVALRQVQDERDTAALLLHLAHRLADASTVQDVATGISEAVRELTGSDRSAVYLWNDAEGRLGVAASAGWPADEAARVASFGTTPEQSAELSSLLAQPAPIVLHRSTSPWAEGVLEDFGLQTFIGVPIIADGTLLGVVGAHWCTRLRALDDPLTDRLAGLAGQAATALSKARLLEEVRNQATRDPLTGLANRRQLDERLSLALAQTQRDGRPTGLLFCDLNRFKRINDSLGHAAGDELLQTVAQRLAAAVRDGDTVARPSGDEFLVVLPSLTDAADARAVAERLEQCLSQPLTVAGTRLFCDAAVGMAISTDGREDPEALIARADDAMYQRKARQRGERAVARPRGSDQLRLETDLRHAVGRDELRVHYQPQLDIATSLVVGVEALVRWQHPTRGLLPPADFVPLAEATGLIPDIGRWVLRQACTDAADWLDRGLELEVAANVAASELDDPHFHDHVAAVLEETGLPARLLVLEITESQLVHDPVTARRALQRLHAGGVQVSIDDFGTGYSSLVALRRMPAVEVKVDRSFVAELTDDPTSHSLVAAVVGLARGLDLRVVAEGIETAQQLELVRQLGCHRAQGYLIARPAPRDGLEQLLQARTGRRAAGAATSRAPRVAG